MSTTVKRPGYMLRACVAWVILNAVLIFTLSALVFVLPRDQLAQWYVMIPIIVAVVASQWIIMGETIAPIIKEWIKQEEYVKDGEKPSWQS
jgi:hypothetical protein